MDFLLDTSFLVCAMDGKIDIRSELSKFGRPCLFVLDLVVKELERLGESNGRDATNAKLSLLFLKRERAAVIKAGSGNTDRKILEYSLNRNMTVCTVDKELKDRLSRGGMGVITIRQGKFLVRVKWNGR